VESNALKQKGKIILYIIVLMLLLPLGLIAAFVFTLIPGDHPVSLKVILTVIGCFLQGLIFIGLRLLNKFLTIQLIKIKLCTFLFWAGWAIPVSSISLAAVGFTAIAVSETAEVKAEAEIEDDADGPSKKHDLWDWD